jgi:hypothetical protein
MNTIRIGRLDLKCHDISRGIAESSLSELPAAISRQLMKQEDNNGRPPARSLSMIGVSGNTAPAAFANAVARRLAGTIRARIASRVQPPNP